MFQKTKRTVRQTMAVVEKEFLLKLRFPLGFISSIFTASIISLIPLIFIFSGLLGKSNDEIFAIFYFTHAEKNLIYYCLLYQSIENLYFNSINQFNFLSWLLMGNILFTFCNKGFTVFTKVFYEEKYWNTIQGMLLTPVNKVLILFGNLIMVLIESSIYFSLAIIICLFIYPVPIYNVISFFLIGCIMLIASGGIGFIVGAILLTNENFNTIFQLVQFTILFFSCYSIPIIMFPETFQHISFINPFYHGVSTARNVYYGIFGQSELFSLIYIITFAISISMLSVYIFNKLWKKYGISGY
ncbi:MAG: ABC transporter permease [Candidatus Hodarchaeota archaeon]